NKIEKTEDYVAYLRTSPAEIDSLYEDILIKVTSFFRDPECFESLKKHVFPQILRNRTSTMPVRVWVPGCATGEEAYSIVICLLEALGDKADRTTIQMLATDISELALRKARSGKYVENIALDVSPQRLAKFFTKTKGFYQIK